MNDLAFPIFAAAVAYSAWLLGWRCRPGNTWTDLDGIRWNIRAAVLVALSLFLVTVAAVNWAAVR